jgi:lactoylglutathione lyase
MEFLHTMVRISDIDASLKFYCDGLGLKNVRRYDNEKGRFSLIFLASPDDLARSGLTGTERPLPPGLPMIELTYNWDEDSYSVGRNFGHLAYRVENIYAICQKLMDMGVTINRPPRDGHMAFVRSPDNISIELLQKGEHLPPAAPWKDMENEGVW